MIEQLDGYGPIQPPAEDYGMEFREGQEAFLAGRPLSDNDYPRKGRRAGLINNSYAAWKSGWMAASEASQRHSR